MEYSIKVDGPIQCRLVKMSISITKLPDIQSQIEEVSLSNDVRSVINMYLRALIA
jgi:hypothetical protein